MTEGTSIVASLSLGAFLLVGKCLYHRYDFVRAVVVEAQPDVEGDSTASPEVPEVEVSFPRVPQFRVRTDWVPPSYDLIAPTPAPSLGFDYEHRAIQRAEQAAYDAARAYSDQTAGLMGAIGGVPLDPGLPPSGGW